MVKDQEFLEKKALYCLGLAKKMGATQSSVVVNNSISETEFFTTTLESVAPNFFAKPKQYDAFVSKNS